MKYEEVYLKAYANGLEARNGLGNTSGSTTTEAASGPGLPRTPAEVFHGEPVEEELKERGARTQPALVSYGGVQESHLIVA